MVFACPTSVCVPIVDAFRYHALIGFWFTPGYEILGVMTTDIPFAFMPFSK